MSKKSARQKAAPHKGAASLRSVKVKPRATAKAKKPAKAPTRVSKSPAQKKPTRPAAKVKTAPRKGANKKPAPKASPKPVKRPAPAKPTKPAPRKAPRKAPSKKPAPKPQAKGRKVTAPGKPARLKPLRLELQSERVVTPSGKGRADKYRYPKGHPKAGQYAPKSEAQRIGSVRYIRRKSGKREAIEPHGRGKLTKTSTAPIGRSFTELAQAYTIADSVKNANEQNKSVYVRIGGQVYKVPDDRRLDVAAWVIDIKLRSQSIARENNDKGGSVQPVSFNFTTGVNGVFLDLDEAGFADEEIAEEFGNDAIGEELAAYMSSSARTFLGIRVSSDDVLDAWNENIPEDDEDDTDEE